MELIWIVCLYARSHFIGLKMRWWTKIQRTFFHSTRIKLTANRNYEIIEISNERRDDDNKKTRILSSCPVFCWCYQFEKIWKMCFHNFLWSWQTNDMQECWMVPFASNSIIHWVICKIFSPQIAFQSMTTNVLIKFLPKKNDARWNHKQKFSIGISIRNWFMKRESKHLPSLHRIYSIIIYHKFHFPFAVNVAIWI